MLAGFDDAVLEFLKGRGVDAVKVVDLESRTAWGGYCETCEYSYVVLDIEYVDSDSMRRTYTYDGDFGEFIREL
jgi:hypothetical protein